MTDASENLKEAALTNEELRFLEAIKRTQEDTSLPPGMNLDVGAVAAKAFAAYLEEAPPPPVIVVPPGSIFNLNKAVTDLMPEAIEQKPTTHFGRDFLYTVVPTIILILFGVAYFLFRTKVDLSSEFALRISILFTIIAGLLFTAGFLWNPERLSRHWQSLRYSSGALVGGLAVTTFGLLMVSYVLQQKHKWQMDLRNNRIETTSRALAEVGFATVGKTPVDSAGDHSLEAKTRRNFVGIEETASLQLKSDEPGKRVDVEAKSEDVPTSVILQIQPYRANVYSANPAQPDYEILTGTVHNYSKDFIEIKPDDASMKEPIKINLKESSEELMLADLPEIKETGLQGQEVKVLFVPKSSQAIKMSLLRQGAPPRVIYNADSASLKRAAIIP